MKRPSANGRRICAEFIVDVYEKNEPGGPSHVGGGGEEVVIYIGDDVYTKTGTKSVLLGDCGGGASDGGSYGSVGVAGGSGGSGGGGGGVPSQYGPATLDDYDNYGRYIGSDPYYIRVQQLNDLDQRGFGLSTQERQYLMAHPEFIESLNRSADIAGDGSIQSVISALQGLQHNLTPQERQTLGEGNWYYKFNLHFYLVNAYDAQHYTVDNFSGQNPYCSSCRANAFKHALFRMLDAKIFGPDMAAQLGRDHEAITDPNLDGPERRMDLSNNNVGITIFTNKGYGLITGVNTLINDVLTEMNTPHSRFIYIKGNISVTADTP